MKNFYIFVIYLMFFSSIITGCIVAHSAIPLLGILFMSALPNFKDFN
jgi:hypothetical protein